MYTKINSICTKLISFHTFFEYTFAFRYFCIDMKINMEKSDGIRANMNRIRLRPSTPMPSNSLKSGNGTSAGSIESDMSKSFR